MSFTPVAIRARDSTESTTSQHEPKVTICLEQKFYTAPAQDFFLSRSLLEMSEKRNPVCPNPRPIWIHGGCLLALVTPSPSRTPTLSALRFFSYASGSFDYEISSAVYEGRPFTTIVFVSVFIPVGGEFGVPV